MALKISFLCTVINNWKGSLASGEDLANLILKTLKDTKQIANFWGSTITRLGMCPKNQKNK